MAIAVWKCCGLTMRSGFEEGRSDSFPTQTQKPDFAGVVWFLYPYKSYAENPGLSSRG